MPSQKRKPRVLSGIQSSGNLHIGNYPRIEYPIKRAAYASVMALSYSYS